MCTYCLSCKNGLAIWLQVLKCNKCIIRGSTILKKKSSKDPANLRLLIVRAKQSNHYKACCCVV